MEQIFIDEETGENIVRPLMSCEAQEKKTLPPPNDAETGEPEIDVSTGVKRRRVRFQVI